MYLRDIGISIIRPGDSREVYLRSAEHLVEILLRFLPRKFTLDGMGKTNITLGQIEEKPRYCQMINVNQYCFEEFDFVAYDRASLKEKDDLILNAIEFSLIDIATRFGSDANSIRQAVAATRMCGFELRGYTKLSRFTKSRNLHVKVFQQISRRGFEWGIDLVSRKGEILQSLTIATNIDSWRSAHSFRKSRWDGERFEIVDYLGKPSYKLNVGPLERKLLSEKSEYDR